MVHELCQREEEAGRVTPPEYATSGGYGSPLRGAHRKGPPRGGRHQPLLSELPTVFVHITGKFFPTRLRRSPFYLRHQVSCGLLCIYRSAVLTFWLQIYLLDSLVLALSACGENTAGISINWLMINYLSLRHITQDLFIIIPLAFLFPFKPDYKTVQKPPLSGPSLWMRPSAFSLARCFSMAFGVIPIISASLRAE